MRGIIPKIQIYLKRNTPTILTCLGAVGVVGTSVLAVKATPKAMRLLEKNTDEKGEKLTTLEVIAIAGPAYIPAVVMGASTITCIFGANVLNKRQQAALTSAYALLENSYKEYHNKLIELYGKEADEKIRDSIVLQNCMYHQINVDEPDEKLIWVDELSGNTICRYEKEIIDAEYHFNRNFALGGSMSLNDLYEFLGMPEVDGGDEIGWSLCDGYQWIDFEHRLVSRDDGGTPIYVISTVFPPEPFDDMCWKLPRNLQLL